MLKRVGCALLVLFACSGIRAQTLDLNLSNDTAEAAFSAPFASTSFGKSAYQISVLFSENDADNNWITGAGFFVSGEAGADAPGLEFGVGVNVYIGEVSTQQFAAIPLGAQVTYRPPLLNRFFTKLAVEYAPDIVTFNDGDKLLLSLVRAGYEILPNADIYVGYRNTQVGIKDGPNMAVDEGWHVGVHLSF